MNAETMKLVREALESVMVDVVNQPDDRARCSTALAALAALDAEQAGNVPSCGDPTCRAFVHRAPGTGPCFYPTTAEREKPQADHIAIAGKMVTPDARMEEIEARCNAATPGPWLKVYATIGYLAVLTKDPSDSRLRRPDRKFIAHARDDVPWLLARVRDLEAVLRQWREAAEIAKVSGLELARKFHDTYERLAPSFGYETRKDTKAFDPESANGKLMIAVCDEIGNEIEANAFKAGFNTALHYQHAYSTDIACRAAKEQEARNET